MMLTSPNAGLAAAAEKAWTGGMFPEDKAEFQPVCHELSRVGYDLFKLM